ncbi:MAG: hypothetical protein NE334_14140 [Lentisphaeraceae bacterium]|nr:hypothetical protein [Lentisphaeraceae bacterium]
MKDYIYNVFITYILIIGGFALSASISPAENLYPTVTLVCIIPALLFIKNKLNKSWSKFIPNFLYLIMLVISIKVLDHFELPPIIKALAIGLIIYIFFNVLEKEKKLE